MRQKYFCPYFDESFIGIVRDIQINGICRLRLFQGIVELLSWNAIWVNPSLRLEAWFH